jgi:pimeloyl-ACP methyl ester carboxylesterase
VRIYLILLLVAITNIGCFSRFTMTTKELRTYYKEKHPPTYFVIQNDSVKLFCATTGADTLPPLLLVHGAPGAWYGSRAMLADTQLKKRFHMIAIDRLGYNHSTFKGKRKAVVSIQTQAVAINEALQLNRSRQKATVVGSSYGAPIAAKMTLLYPQNYDHLVMLAGALDPEREKFWWFSKPVRYGPLRWLLPRFINHATDEKFAHVRELKKLLPEWNNISVPVTVVQGGKDNIVNPVNFDFARKKLQDKSANFIFLPEASHLIRWQYPDLVKQIVLQPFVNSVNKTATSQ